MKRYHRAVKSYNRYSLPKNKVAVKTGEITLKDSDIESLVNESVAEMKLWDEQGYRYSHNSISSPLEGDDLMVPDDWLCLIPSELTSKFRKMADYLNNIFWPHVLARMYGHEKIRSALFGERYFVVNGFCHGKHEVDKDLNIYPYNRKSENENRPGQFAYGLICYGCHFEERYVTSFVVKQVHFDAGKIRAFFQPYYDWESHNHPDIPQKISELTTEELTAALIGKEVTDDN